MAAPETQSGPWPTPGPLGDESGAGCSPCSWIRPPASWQAAKLSATGCPRLQAAGSRRQRITQLGNGLAGCTTIAGQPFETNRRTGECQRTAFGVESNHERGSRSLDAENAANRRRPPRRLERVDTDEHEGRLRSVESCIPAGWRRVREARQVRPQPKTRTVAMENALVHIEHPQVRYVGVAARQCLWVLDVVGPGRHPQPSERLGSRLRPTAPPKVAETPQLLPES